MDWIGMLSKGNCVSHNYVLHAKHPNPFQVVTANLVLLHFPHRSCALIHNLFYGLFSLSEGIRAATAPRLLSCHLQQEVLMDEAD